MSFINKLLRKTEPLTPTTGATAPLDERALEATPAVWQELADGFQAADPADETRADDPAPTPADAALRPPEQADSPAWWEEAAPALPADAGQTTAKTIEIPEPPAETEQTPQTAE